MTPPPEPRSARWTLNAVAVTAAGLVLTVCPLLLWISWTPDLFVGVLLLALAAGAVAGVFGPSFVEQAQAADAARAPASPRVDGSPPEQA